MFFFLSSIDIFMFFVDFCVQAVYFLLSFSDLLRVVLFKKVFQACFLGFHHFGSFEMIQLASFENTCLRVLTCFLCDFSLKSFFERGHSSVVFFFSHFSFVCTSFCAISYLYTVSRLFAHFEFSLFYAVCV